jgi:hypothetical protein
LILGNNPNFKKPDLQSWAKHFDLMIRLDKGRTVENIREVMAWSQEDSFWQGNILSSKKLRDKFDQLVIRMKAPKPQVNSKTPNFGADRTTKSSDKYEKFYL